MVMHDAIETSNNTNNVVMQRKDTSTKNTEHGRVPKMKESCLTSFEKSNGKNKSSEKEPRKTDTIRDEKNEKIRQLPLRTESHNSYKPPAMLNGTMSPPDINQRSKSLDGDQWSFSEGDLEPIIAPTKSQRLLMTQVSSLDLDDSAFGDFSNGKVSQKDDDSSTAPGMNVQGEYLKNWVSAASNHHHTDADESSDDSYTPQHAYCSRRNADEVNSGPTGCSVPRQPPPPIPTGTGTDSSHKKAHLSFSYVPPRGSFPHRTSLPRMDNSPNRPISTCGRSPPSGGGPFRSEVSASPPRPFVPPPGSFIHRTPTTITATTTTRRKTLPGPFRAALSASPPLPFVPPPGSFIHRTPTTTTTRRKTLPGTFRAAVSASPPRSFVPPPGSFVHRTPTTTTTTTTTRRKTLPQHNHSPKEEESIDGDRNDGRHQSDPLLTSSPFMDSNTSLEYDDKVNQELSTHGVFK
jgi:hypothetical protein